MLRRVPGEPHNICDVLRVRDEREIAVLAERQYGVVSTAQLRSSGLSANLVYHRVTRGRLHRIHRGVYAVGHARLTFRGWLWAAILACGGPRVASISHACAAAVWDLRGIPSGAIDVTTPRAATSREGIRAHESTLPPDASDHDGLPVTSVARTLVDLAGTERPDRLAALCRRAEFHRLLDVTAIETLLPGRRGARALRRAIRDLADTGPELTRSDLEEMFLSLVARHGLPAPLVNVRVLGFTVDFFWPVQRLVVETDGARAHMTASAFERDRRRDSKLVANGLRVMRFTPSRVAGEPASVAAELRAALGA
jgi:hypothetical protein